MCARAHTHARTHTPLFLPFVSHSEYWTDYYTIVNQIRLYTERSRVVLAAENISVNYTHIWSAVNYYNVLRWWTHLYISLLIPHYNLTLIIGDLFRLNQFYVVGLNGRLFAIWQLVGWMLRIRFVEIGLRFDSSSFGFNCWIDWLIDCDSNEGFPFE